MHHPLLTLDISENFALEEAIIDITEKLFVKHISSISDFSVTFI